MFKKCIVIKLYTDVLILVHYVIIITNDRLQQVGKAAAAPKRSKTPKPRSDSMGCGFIHITSW